MQADVRIEAPEMGAPRGVLAERSFSPDEVIMSIPESIAIPFEGSPEEATVLLLHLKHNRQRQNQYRSWLDALPGPQDFVAWDTVEDETLSMLQCPEMEDAVRERRERLERVWQEDEEQGVIYSRQELLGSRNIHWDEVQWAANVVRSRNWTMGLAESGERLCVLMPMLDMVNHDRTSPNKIRYRSGAFELVHRGAGIAAGEEITYSYEGEGHELRNDQAALDYCFMLPFSDDSRLFQVDAVASSAACAEMGQPQQRASWWKSAQPEKLLSEHV
ncbi:g8228 [Coccomyxa elongata]